MIAIDMEEPINCYKCPCGRGISDDIWKCGIRNRVVDHDDVLDKPSWCPIKEKLPKNYSDLMNAGISRYNEKKTEDEYQLLLFSLKDRKDKAYKRREECFDNETDDSTWIWEEKVLKKWIKEIKQEADTEHGQLTSGNIMLRSLLD